MNKSEEHRGKGRPRGFDRENALNTALNIFGQQGYEPASVAELCERMGINPPSLYATFGNKATLFMEAVRHYENTYLVEPSKRFMAEKTYIQQWKNFLTSLPKSFYRQQGPAAAW